MAKKDSTNVPSVLSKANRDISTILEQDMRKESELLKDLVDKVLQSNLEVNKEMLVELKKRKKNCVI